MREIYRSDQHGYFNLEGKNVNNQHLMTVFANINSQQFALSSRPYRARNNKNTDLQAGICFGEAHKTMQGASKKRKILQNGISFLVSVKVRSHQDNFLVIFLREGGQKKCWRGGPIFKVVLILRSSSFLRL